MKPEPPSYGECVRRVLRAAQAPMPFPELLDAVARIRPLNSSHPDRTIRSALAETWQIVHTGEGYGFLPYLLKGSVFRIPLTSEAIRAGTLVLTEETFCALWPSFHEIESLRDERPARIQLQGGITFKEPVAHLKGYRWGWQKSRVLRDWLHRSGAKKGDALILTVRDGEARRYTLRVESHSDRDETRIAERNRALHETAYRLFRANPGPPWYLAPRLIAHGVYRDPCPPDPLLPMMEQDARFEVAQARREETPTPAERRKMAEDRLEEGLEWLDRGNAREAEKSFWQSIVADETFADGYNHLGILTFERGDWQRAEEFYRLALAEARKEFDLNNRRLGWWSRMETRPLMRALHGLGLCQWKQRHYRQALATFERMMALNPNDNQGVRYLIGVLYHELCQRDQAARWYRQTADNPHVLFNWALLCFETRHPVDAITHILQGIVANPYVAPRLLGRAAPWYGLWHVSTREEPKTATDYRDQYRRLWKRKGALEFLRAVWKHPRTHAYLTEFIALRTQLMETRDGERRRALIDAESRLRDASDVRAMARAIAHDLDSHTARV